MADIMCQHFSPKSLVEVSGAMFEEGLGVNVEDVQVKMLQQQPNPVPPAIGRGLAGGAGAPLPPPGGAPAAGLPPSNVVPFQARPGGVGGLPAPMGGAPQNPPLAPPVAPGLPLPPPPDPMQIATQQALQRIDAAISLLRNERLRGFRVDIEVDSTIYGDAAQEKGDRTEFISEVTKYLQSALQMSAQVPEITPLLGKLLQFGVRGFRVGRDLEASIEEFCDQAVKIAKEKQAQAASQPNPEQIKAQAQAMQAQATMKAADARANADVAKSQADIQAAQIDSQTNQQQAQAEVERQNLENQGEMQNNQTNLIIKQMELRMREMELQIEQMRMHAEMNKPQTPPTNPKDMSGAA